MGIAYPLIINKTTNIDERFNSKNLSRVFAQEFPQKEVKIFKFNLKISFFELALYIALFFLLVLILGFKPLKETNLYIINNSAKILVLITTVNLIVFFLLWLKKVYLFNNNSQTILRHLINRYESSKKIETQNLSLKTINELAIYAINQQDEHIQEQLLKFYSSLVYHYRTKVAPTKAVEYPSDFYYFVNRLIRECVNENNKNLLAIQHRAVSGAWLIPNDFKKRTISGITYERLWENIIITSNNTDFIKEFWENSYQYYRFELENITPSGFNPKVDSPENLNEIIKREKEQDKFKEFHFALGSLMLYKQDYKAVKHFLSFAQSNRPEYVLFPQNMSGIFTWFNFFSDDYRHLKKPLSLKYPFPGLNNFITEKGSKYWICNYLIILFLQQFVRQSYFTFQDFKAQPKLPNEIELLSVWLRNLNYFKFCFNEVISNKQIIGQLGYENLINNDFNELVKFIERLEKDIKLKLDKKKLSAKLEEENIRFFLNSSENILKKAFDEYEDLNNSYSVKTDKNDIELYLKGSLTLLPKSAFTKEGPNHLNYNEVFAKSLAKNVIHRYIPNSFITARTQSYLLNESNFLNGLKVLIRKKNKENIRIIVFNDWSGKIRERIKESDLQKQTKYYTASNRMRNLIFVLDKDDLPIFKYKDIPEENKDLDLKPINKKYNLYGSVIDIHNPHNKNIKEKYINPSKLSSDTELQVLVALYFLTTIRWKNDRELIQINVNTEYDELGSESNISDLIPLSNKTRI